MFNWDEYYMEIAKSVAKSSRDPSTKVGCVIVSKDNKPVSFGSNDFISDCDEKFIIMEKPEKDLMIVHAEMNAILSAKTCLKDCKVYTTHASCENCLKHMLQAGIREFIYEKFDTNGHFMTGERKKIITALLKSTNAVYRNINGKTFFEEASI